MQDTDPFFDPKLVMYRVAKEIWPDLDENFHTYFTHFDAQGNAVPTLHGEPMWDTVTWGFSEGQYTIRPGVDGYAPYQKKGYVHPSTNLDFNHHIFIFFGNIYVSVDQWGQVYRYIPESEQGRPRHRYERRLATIVADVLRDIRSEAEAIHVQAEEFNREFWG